MLTVSSPGIGSAFLILFNLLYFVGVMLASSLYIENIWIGRSRWIVLPILVISVVVFYFYPGLFLQILEGVVGPFSVNGILSVTGFGILAGMAMSSL
jgi:hypothetical protein